MSSRIRTQTNLNRPTQNPPANRGQVAPGRLGLVTPSGLPGERWNGRKAPLCSGGKRTSAGYRPFLEVRSFEARQLNQQQEGNQ